MQKQNEPAAEWLEVGDLTPWADNPRVNDHAVGQVAKSIERFGFAAPIVARRDGDGLEVVAGHTRLKAAHKLGLDRVPVRVLDLDPADARLLALADNRLGEIADWSDDLGDLMQRLDDEGLDLEGLGWSDEELAALLAPEAIEAEPEADADLDGMPDEVPAVTQPGDVVELGRHVLHCGDCLEVMRAMPDNSIDAVVTDPPYGIGFMGKDWDCAVPGEDFAREALRVLKPGGHLIAFAATRTVHRLAVAVEDAGFELRDQIAWVQWQGFPKSHNVAIQIDKAAGALEHRGVRVKHHRGQEALARAEGLPPYEPATEDAKRWAGWGTALKPAYEPAILARKPLEGTVAANVLKWGSVRSTLTVAGMLQETGHGQDLRMAMVDGAAAEAVFMKAACPEQEEKRARLSDAGQPTCITAPSRLEASAKRTTRTQRSSHPASCAGWFGW